eukprot:37371_1
MLVHNSSPHAQKHSTKTIARFIYAFLLFTLNIVLFYGSDEKFLTPSDVILIIFIINHLRQIIERISFCIHYLTILLREFVIHALYICLCGFNIIATMLIIATLLIIVFCVVHKNEKRSYKSNNKVVVSHSTRGVSYILSSVISAVITIPFMYFNDMTYFKSKWYMILIILSYFYDELNKIIGVYSNIVRYVYGACFIIVNAMYLIHFEIPTNKLYDNHWERLYCIFSLFLAWILWTMTLCYMVRSSL